MLRSGLTTCFHWNARHPWWTLLVLALLTTTSGWALGFIPYVDLIDSFISTTSAERAYYDELTETFVTDQVIVVAIEPADDLFDADNLETLRRLELELGQLAGVKDTLAIPSSTYFAEGEERFTTEPLVPAHIPRSRDGLERIRRRTLGEPLYRGAIISMDGRMAAINVRLQKGLKTEDRLALCGQLERSVLRFTTSHPTWRVLVSGQPWINYKDGMYQQEDLGRMIPLVLLIVAVVMLLSLRRLTGAVLSLIGCASFMVMAVALLVPTGGSINSCTVMIPPFAFVMAVTVMAHFWSELRLHWMESRDHLTALHMTIENLTFPTAFANFTTAVGFGSLAISDIPALREFGIAMGIGMVLIVFVLMAFCAAVARLVPVHWLITTRLAPTQAHPASVRLFDALGRRLLARPVPWLVIIASIAAASAWGVSRIRIESNSLEMFQDDDSVVRSALAIGKRFGGVSSIYIALDGTRPEQMKDPSVLQVMEELERFMAEQLGTGYSLSLAGYTKTMHRAFFGGDAARQRLPDTEAQVAQLLLLNGEDDIYDVVSRDYSRGVVVAWTNEFSSSKLRALKARLLEHLQTLPDVGVHYRLSGTLVLDMELYDDVAQSTLASFLLSLLIIFVLRIVQFRHWGLGVTSLLPNVYPILVTFGLMGLADIALNISTAISASVTLGIADDETIHFFAGYQARRAAGLGAREAVMHTLREKGSGMFIATVILLLGFSVLLVSTFGATRYFGVVLAVSLVISLFANVVFGPILLDRIPLRLDPPRG